MTVDLLKILKSLAPSSLVASTLDRQLQRVNAELERVSRELDAELAENERLVDELVKVRREHAEELRVLKESAGTGPGDSSAYLRQQVELHKANAARLENLLAAAERRPDIGSTV